MSHHSSKASSILSEANSTHDEESSIQVPKNNKKEAPETLDPLILQLTQEIIERKKKENEQEEHEDETEEMEIEPEENHNKEDNQDIKNKLNEKEESQIEEEDLVEKEDEDKEESSKDQYSLNDDDEKIIQDCLDVLKEENIQLLELENDKKKDNDNSEPESSSNEDIPAPPDGIYPDPEVLKTSVKDFAQLHVYAIVFKRSVPGKSITFKCDRLVSLFFDLF